MNIDKEPCILILDLPPPSLAGIGLLSFTTSAQFQGIKHVPPGFHFVFASVTSASSIRYGVWCRIKSSESNASPDLVINKWDPAKEQLIGESDNDTIFHYRKTLESIWEARLTPYRQSAGSEGETVEEKLGDWSEMTDCISETLLSRITGGQGNHWALTTASSARRDMDDIPGLSKEQSMLQPDRELNFLPVDLKRTWRDGATGRERTDAARDWSWALGDLIERFCHERDEMELVGEMQFTFLMVLTLNNHSCLEQWKRILSLMFGCRAAVRTRESLFVRAIATLKLQLRHSQDVEGGLFDLSEDGAPLLKLLLRRFKKALESEFGKDTNDVRNELDELELYLRSEHGWDLEDSLLRKGMLELEDGEQVEMDLSGFDEEDETGEYAPVIVDLEASPESGRSRDAEDNIDDVHDRGEHEQPEYKRVMSEGPQFNRAEHEGPKTGEDFEEEEGDLEELDSRY